MFLDEYGRYRAANYKKPRVRSRSFEEWQSYFDNAREQTSAAPVSAAETSAAPNVSDVGSGSGSGGGDVADNQDMRGSLPEYDNAQDWVEAMGRTPSGFALDAVMGRGMFGSRDKSYTNVRGDFIDNGEFSDMNVGDLVSKNDNTEAGSRSAGDPDGIGIDGSGAGPSINDVEAGVDNGRGAGDPDGIGLAEGGSVFNSPEQVPGPVKGPGGPKDDMVDANLSNGEFVSTTEATQTFGEDFLTGLNDIARNPQAQGLMANPAFEQAKQEFLTNVQSLMAPPQGAAPAPGAPTPPPGEAPVETPMGAQPGFADGGTVSQGEYAAAKADLDRAIRGRDAARLNKSMGTSLMGDRTNYDAQVAAAQARLRQLQNDSKGFADGGMIEDPLKFMNDIEQARGAGTAGGAPKQPGTGFKLVGKPYNTPNKEPGTGFTMVGEEGKAAPKGRGIMAPLSDFFDDLMGMYDRMRNLHGNKINADPALEDKRPNPKLIEDDSYLKRSNNAKDITPREKAGVDSVAGNVGKGLLSRVVGGPLAAGATMALNSKELNADEDELLRTTDLRHGYNPKESRTKDDTASAPTEDGDKSFMKENMKKEADSLFKKPKKTKETSKEDNKLSPNAGLGDALEFYKRKGVDKFTWEGQTYVRSNDSPTGFVLT